MNQDTSQLAAQSRMKQSLTNASATEAEDQRKRCEPLFCTETW